jgi:hypothetical protein
MIMSSGCPPAAQWIPLPLTVSRQTVVPVTLVPQWLMVLPAEVPVPLELTVTSPSGAVSLPKVAVPKPDPLRLNKIPLSNPAADFGFGSRLKRSTVMVLTPVVIVADASAEVKVKESACAVEAVKNRAEAVRSAAVPRDLIAGSFIIFKDLPFFSVLVWIARSIPGSPFTYMHAPCQCRSQRRYWTKDLRRRWVRWFSRMRENLAASISGKKFA